jgi:hypothetical protein
LSDFAIHLTADIIGEAGSLLSWTRALLAPAKPVLRILDNSEPLAKLAAKRSMASCDYRRRCVSNLILPPAIYPFRSTSF